MPCCGVVWWVPPDPLQEEAARRMSDIADYLTRFYVPIQVKVLPAAILEVAPLEEGEGSKVQRAAPGRSRRAKYPRRVMHWVDAHGEPGSCGSSSSTSTGPSTAEVEGVEGGETHDNPELARKWRRPGVERSGKPVVLCRVHEESGHRQVQADTLLRFAPAHSLSCDCCHMNPCVHPQPLEDEAARGCVVPHGTHHGGDV